MATLLLAGGERRYEGFLAHQDEGACSDEGGGAAIGEDAARRNTLGKTSFGVITGNPTKTGLLVVLGIASPLVFASSLAARRRRPLGGAAAVVAQSVSYSEEEELPEPACASDYEEDRGNVVGGGTFGDNLHVKTPSSRSCATRCNSHPACMSYEWSPSEFTCHLNKERLPGTITPFKDYLFCRKPIRVVTDCPKGYEVTKGHHKEGHQFAHSADYYLPSIDACAKRCSEEEDCLSFEYSPARAACVRHAKAEPDSEDGRADFKFCVARGARHSEEEKPEASREHPAARDSEEEEAKPEAERDKRREEPARPPPPPPPTALPGFRFRHRPEPTREQGCGLPGFVCPEWNWIHQLANGPQDALDDLGHSLRDCAKDCAKDEECLSFEYNSLQEACLLHKVEMPRGTLREQGSVFYQKTGDGSEAAEAATCESGKWKQVCVVD